MSITKTLGGDRLGAGKKMQAELHNYNRSTHDLSYIWRSTMAAGTLVPFMKQLALPGDTFDIDLNCNVMTHPTLGPLFGSFKVQLDVFMAPIRLYQGLLHNNKLGIGMNMAAVKLPQLEFEVPYIDIATRQKLIETGEIDNFQSNPSSIMSYLGVRGFGINTLDADPASFYTNAVPYLAYWEIFKNYYANKQETNAYVIHTAAQEPNETVNAIEVNAESEILQAPNEAPVFIAEFADIQVSWSGSRPNYDFISVKIGTHWYKWNESFILLSTTSGLDHWSPTGAINQTVVSWRYDPYWTPLMKEITLEAFELENIDKMRNDILKAVDDTTPFIIDKTCYEPYGLMFQRNDFGFSSLGQSQEGLAVKTYQSDLFNNWLSQEWIDGANGISEVTKVDTTDGGFTIDTLNLANKVYNMLNRIAVSGGSYDDWIDAVYANDKYRRVESPMYLGSLIKELVFQEVVSNAAADATGTQPLGTLAGRGTLSGKHKGGKITARIEEPSYLIGIVSLTPRLDYSQGNDWDVKLGTMDDLHKPALDEIGFQDLITQQMASWDAVYNDTNKWNYRSAGKQPAWINYMTNVNKVRGNFAIRDNEEFMVLVRRYEALAAGDDQGVIIKDLTTYIDPVKFNQIFADTALDSQNFWVQIGADIQARRIISAKLIPNL